MQSKDPNVLTRKNLFCGDCLVGQTIPVYRPTIRRWNIGEIDYFDRTAWAHRVVFEEDDIEWVTVSSSPFNDYISYHKEQNSQQEKIIDLFEPLDIDIDMNSLCSKDSTIERGSGDYLIFRDGEFSFEQEGDVEIEKHPEDLMNFPVFQDVFVPKDNIICGYPDDSMISLDFIANEEGHKDSEEHHSSHHSPSVKESEVDGCVPRKAPPRLWASEVSDIYIFPSLSLFQHSF